MEENENKIFDQQKIILSDFSLFLSLLIIYINIIFRITLYLLHSIVNENKIVLPVNLIPSRKFLFLYKTILFWKKISMPWNMTALTKSASWKKCMPQINCLIIYPWQNILSTKQNIFFDKRKYLFHSSEQ